MWCVVLTGLFGNILRFWVLTAYERLELSTELPCNGEGGLSFPPSLPDGMGSGIQGDRRSRDGVGVWGSEDWTARHG